ncbi:MAG: hypothetical protein CMB45_04745 [Euryarchaeota archaeon]|nr:hypothetical protein [Euryarchaeota archaeon]
MTPIHLSTDSNVVIVVRTCQQECGSDMENLVLLVFSIIVLIALFGLWEYVMHQMLHGPHANTSPHPIQQKVIKFGEEE